VDFFCMVSGRKCRCWANSEEAQRENGDYAVLIIRSFGLPVPITRSRKRGSLELRAAVARGFMNDATAPRASRNWPRPASHLY